MLTILICLIMLVTTVSIHYAFFKGMSSLIDIRAHKALTVIAVVMLLFLAHLLEVGAYALVYHYSYLMPSIGGVVGEPLNQNLNALYLSMLAYSSLGFSDLVPTGGLRLVVGFEAINGLILITWSASITFLSMVEVFGLDVTAKKNVE